MRATAWKMGLASLAFAAVSSAASAAICTGPGGGNNLLYGEIPEASACNGMFAGNTPNAAINEFGFTWDFLAKQPGDEGPFPGALVLTVDPNSGGMSGTPR